MVWCGVVQCDEVQCVVWHGVLKALLPNGIRRDALHTGHAKREGCVPKYAVCVMCCAPVAEGRPSLWCCAAAVRAAQRTPCRSASCRL